MKPRWMVYGKTGDSYPVALDTALDWNRVVDSGLYRLLPGPWETIRCSSMFTAQRIADWLNAQAEEIET